MAFLGDHIDHINYDDDDDGNGGSGSGSGNNASLAVAAFRELLSFDDNQVLDGTFMPQAPGSSLSLQAAPLTFPSSQIQPDLYAGSLMQHLSQPPHQGLPHGHYHHVGGLGQQGLQQGLLGQQNQLLLLGQQNQQQAQLSQHQHPQRPQESYYFPNQPTTRQRPLERRSEIAPPPVISSHPDQQQLPSHRLLSIRNLHQSSSQPASHNGSLPYQAWLQSHEAEQHRQWQGLQQRSQEQHRPLQAPQPAQAQHRPPQVAQTQHNDTTTSHPSLVFAQPLFPGLSDSNESGPRPSTAAPSSPTSPDVDSPPQSSSNYPGGFYLPFLTPVTLRPRRSARTRNWPLPPTSTTGQAPQAVGERGPSSQAPRSINAPQEQPSFDPRAYDNAIPWNLPSQSSAAPVWPHGQSTDTSDAQAGPQPGDFEYDMFVNYTGPRTALDNPATDNSNAGDSDTYDTTSSVEADEVRPDEGGDAGVLRGSAFPYSPAVPVVSLLQQAPFANCVQQLLSEAGIDERVNLAEPVPADAADEGEPAWQRAYLQIDGRRYSTAESILPETHRTRHLESLISPPSFMRIRWHQPPDTCHLNEYAQAFRDHIQAVCPIIPPQRLCNIVATFLGRHEPPILAENAPWTEYQVQLQIECVVEMLVFALGSVCRAKLTGSSTENEPGPELYARAKGMLQVIVDRKGLIRRDSIRQHEAEETQPGDDSMARDGSSTGDDGDEDGEEDSDEGDDSGSNETERHRPDSRDSRDSQGTAVGIASQPAPTPAVDLVRAHLLAALFCGQLAWTKDAASHVQDASRVLLFLICTPGGIGGANGPGRQGLSLVEYSRHRQVLTDEESEVVRLYWICVLLEFEINGEAGFSPSDGGFSPSELLRHLPEMPDPGAVPENGGSQRAQDEGDTTMSDDDDDGDDDDDDGQTSSRAAEELNIQKNIEGQVCLRRHLNAIYQELYRAGDASVRAATTSPALAGLERQFEDVSLSKPGLVVNILTARARTRYWEGKSYGVLPRLLDADLRMDAAAMNDVVCSLVEVIRAYHGAARKPLILPNAFGAAMLQCRYLLLLFAATRTLPVVDSLVGDDLLRQLIVGTTSTLRGMAGPSGVLSGARRVLDAMLAHLKMGTAGVGAPTAAPEAAAPAPVAAATVSRPSPATGLSLFCPSFSSTAPAAVAAEELASGMATATTASSFLSFPTPDTPYSYSVSCTTSPLPQAGLSAESPYSSPDSVSAPFCASPLSALFATAPTPFPFDTSSGSVSPLPASMSSMTVGSVSVSSVPVAGPVLEPALQPPAPEPLGASPVRQFAIQMGLAARAA